MDLTRIHPEMMKEGKHNQGQDWSATMQNIQNTNIAFVDHNLAYLSLIEWY